MASQLRSIVFVVALAVVVGSATAVVLEPKHTSGPKWAPPAAAWEQLQQLPASDGAIRFYVGLRINQDALDRAYHAVTDFTSPQRGQYLSVEQLAAEVAPANTAVEAVKTWLSSVCGATFIADSLSGDVLTVVAPVSGVEAAFGARMHHFRHRASGRVVVRASGKVPIPAAIAGHVDIIVGLTDFFESKDEQRQLALLKESASRKMAVAAGTASNEPYIAAINGNRTNAQIEFSVFCKNGAETGSASSPCSDVAGQPVVTGFHVVAVPFGNPSSNLTFSVSQSNCHTSSVRTSTACDVNVSVPENTPTVFTLTTLYADGSYSRAYTHPAYVPRPPTTPQSLHDLYNIPKEYRVATNETNSQAVVSFEKQYWSPSDLAMFWKMFDITPNPPNVVGYNDPSPSAAGGEATLDVQMVTGLGQGVNTTTWSFPTGDYIMNWAWAVNNNTLPPITTSISYGDTEVGYEFKTGYGLAYITRMNQELQKMAVRGLTVFAGAGDAGWTNVGEMGNDLSNPDRTCGIMRAFYPSESPYVVSMSASFVDGNVETPVSVRGGRSWTTGGGFSNFTAVQTWQKSAVTGYLARAAGQLPEASMFNASGRGYSDLAAVGDNNICVWRGAVFPLGGTSASGPIMAGIVSLLNDVLLNKGLPVVGHFNPTLYRWAESSPAPAFNDITFGRNNDGDMQPPGSFYPIFCEYGFPAMEGWDAASGLGSPNFAQWVELAVNRQ